MSRLHWMPLYVGDYLADTSHLTIEQSGCYLHLLMSQWRVGYVPDDDAKLAAICRVTRAYFVRHIGPAVRPFFSSDGERLTQGRLERERKKTETKSLAASENAKKMHDKKANINNLASAEAHADALLLQPHLESKKDSEASPLREVPVLVPDVRAELWGDGLAIVRGLTGKPEGPSRAIVGKLAKACGDDCALAMSILREARDLRPVGEPVAWLMAAVKGRADPAARMRAALAVPSPMVAMLAELEASQRRLAESRLPEGGLLQ